MKKTLSFEKQHQEQQDAVKELIAFFSDDKDLSKVIYTDWTAKDVLGHIASWHMSFARNLLDAVNNRTPAPFKGSLAEVNEREVKAMSKYTKNELLVLIKQSQNEIDQNIHNPNIQEIAYKKGSRNYTPLEHLAVVSNHIKRHLRDLKKSYQN